MAILIFFLIVFGVITIVCGVGEAIAHSVYGGLIPTLKQKIYLGLDSNKLRLNPYSSTIIMLSGETFISNLPFAITSKYFIDDVGMVPRWSRLHKEIEQHYKILNDAEYKQTIESLEYSLKHLKK